MMIITKEIQQAFDKQGYVGDKTADKIVVICKLFNPIGAGTWYLYEQDKNNPDWFMAFCNLGDSQMAELGTISMNELMSVQLPLGLKIERDRQFPVAEMILQDVIDKVKSGIHV